jgi:nucleotide-binding universal stress UspA family protein
MQLKRVLIALAGTSADPDVIRLVAAMAKPMKAQLIGIHVIEVRWNLPLDAMMEPELDRGEELLESAKKIAEQSGVSLETELLQARNAAAAIVDTAVERKCDLVVVAMPFRKRLGRVYIGQTVQNVYVNAPCAVLAYRQEETSK